MKYKVVLRESEESFSVSCPGLPGCWSQGKTEEEADLYFESIQIAEKARGDAYHVAVSAYHGMDFLVSWNFGHILNPRVKAVVQQLNTARGISTPLICTPEELMEA